MKKKHAPAKTLARCVLLVIAEHDPQWGVWEHRLDHAGALVYTPKKSRQPAWFWKRRLNEAHACVYVGHSLEEFDLYFAALNRQFSAVVFVDGDFEPRRTVEGAIADVVDSRYFGHILRCVRNPHSAQDATSNGAVHVIESYHVVDEMLRILDLPPQRTVPIIRESKDTRE